MYNLVRRSLEMKTNFLGLIFQLKTEHYSVAFEPDSTTDNWI